MSFIGKYSRKQVFVLESLVMEKKVAAFETWGKLIMAACWIPVKACHLLMEDLAHKDPAPQRQIAKISLFSQQTPCHKKLVLYLHCICICLCVCFCVCQLHKGCHDPEDKLPNSHCFFKKLLPFNFLNGDMKSVNTFQHIFHENAFLCSFRN